MIRMENSGQNGGGQCWIPTASDAGNRGDVKSNIQVQYNTNAGQNMYNTPCSIYNVPTVTLPPNATQTYILDTSNQQQSNQQSIQPNLFQADNKQQYLKCSHWPACKFYTQNETSLKNHELTHVGPQSLYTCTDCNIHFASKTSKDEHTRRKHRTWAKIYSCSHCNFETSVLDEFSEHNVAYHLDSGNSGQIYQCHQCNYSTSWKCFMDSHLLIHSINELDYRANKKAKFDQFNNKDASPVVSSVSIKQEASTVVENNTADSPTSKIETKPNVVSSHSNTLLNAMSPQMTSSSGQQSPLSSSQNITPQTTLANIAPMPQQTQQQQQQAQVTLNNAILTQLTTLTPQHGTSQGFTNQTSTVKQEYRCNMCHTFVTSCPNTLHQHIKSHNTCQECGYTSNSITDLSLHVCHTYDGQNTYTNAIMNSTDSNPPMNFGAINPNYTPYGVNMNSRVSPPRPKKRPGRSMMDDDFQQNVYRCRKCNYGTSWKCFLDSHMLTHAGIN